MTAIVFGKMPAHGDFVSRGWTVEESNPWDVWAAGEILAARRHFGEAFADLFDRAPVWRLAVPLGDARLVGAMAPSADSVGRRFVLVAGRMTDTPVRAMAEACEELIYQAIGEGWTAPKLQAAIEDHATSADDVPPPDGWWTPGNNDFPEAACTGVLPDGLVTLMLTARADAV